jgi:hypothetical protein
MSYEVAQQILDQLAIATELFTVGYLGINFTIYAWKRSAFPAGEKLTSPLTLPQAAAPEPLALPQPVAKGREAIAIPLPEAEPLAVAQPETE